MSRKEKDMTNLDIRNVIEGIVDICIIIHIKKCVALVLLCVPDCTYEQVYGNVSACVNYYQTISYSDGYLF